MSNEKKKIKVNIAQNEFTMITDKSESYTKDIADQINQNIQGILSASSTVSVTAAVILTAFNYCDQINQFKTDESELKSKLQQYLSDSETDKKAIADLTAENEKLKKEIEAYRKRLGTDINGSPISGAVRSVNKTITVSQSEEAAEDDDSFFTKNKSKSQK